MVTTAHSRSRSRPQENPQDALRAVAQAYAHHGWAVFPVEGKVPLTRHGVTDATTDPALVERLFAGSRATGIAVACGASGLLVVDLDGEEGRAAWGSLTARHGGHPRTLTARTSSGFHLYYSGEGPSTARRLGPGIDTRGRGGYVVAPPSVHASGHRYRWHDPSVPIAAAPGWLSALLRPAPPAVVGERRGLPPGTVATAYGRAALDGLAADMRAAPAGCRNDHLVRVAYRAGRLSAAGEVDANAAREVLLEAALGAGLGPVEAARTFSSGFRAGHQLPAVRASR